jgi:hypothetical protein
MLIVNKLTEPGGIKRIELHPNTIRVVLKNGTEQIYKEVKSESNY